MLVSRKTNRFWFNYWYIHSSIWVRDTFSLQNKILL